MIPNHIAVVGLLDAVAIDRERWFNERQQEKRLEQQLRRVRSTSHAANDGGERAFRIC